jgi:DNA modification methylase
MAAMEQELKQMAVIRLPLPHDNLQAIEVMLADNRPGKEATEDEGLLQVLLQEIKEERGDIAGSLYEDRELLKLLREEKKQGHTDIDDAPGKPKTPFAQLGQVWQLGDHRVLCGDATDLPTMVSLMNKPTHADMVFTDPPYNADYTGRSDLPGKMKRMNQTLGIKNDAQGAVAFRRFLEAGFGAIDSHLHPGASVYVCMDWKGYPDTHTAFTRFWNQKSLLVWDKGHFGLGQHYRTQYELILFGWKGDKVSHWHAGQRERDVWKVDREDVQKYRHPTQKPVELVERALNNSSNRGHLILDPFAGSGTTLLAAERSGRTCYAVELDPGFVDVICRRWQEHTEQLPILVGGEEHDFTV